MTKSDSLLSSQATQAALSFAWANRPIGASEPRFMGLHRICGLARASDCAANFAPLDGLEMAPGRTLLAQILEAASMPALVMA